MKERERGERERQAGYCVSLQDPETKAPLHPPRTLHPRERFGSRRGVAWSGRRCSHRGDDFSVVFHDLCSYFFLFLN